MLDIAQTSRMSQLSHLPSGSKRRSELIDPKGPGSYHYPLLQQSNTSQSSEASTSASPHSSQEVQTPKSVGQFPSLSAGTGLSSDVVGTQVDAFIHASSSKMRPPTPSPMSSAAFTLPPMALSSPRHASYTPQSGNPHHITGTDHLTIQTLQRENSDLTSAYAQAQVYIADLNSKVQASRAENGRLAMERNRLTGKIEFLEAQLEELEQSIQQTQAHTAAKDAQYSRIVELSTRLQSQGAAASQTRKAEQQEWSFEKKSMQSVIDSLNKEVKDLRKTYASYAKLTNLTPLRIEGCPDGIEGNPGSAAESSLHGLIAEMEALRRANVRMEGALAGVRGDNAQLAEYVEKLGSVENNIRMHIQMGKADLLDREQATGEE